MIRVECQACSNNQRSKRTKQKISKTVNQFHDSGKQNGRQHGGRGRRHGRQHPGLESDKVDPQLDVTGTSNQPGVGKIIMRKDPKDQTWKIAPKNVDLTAERLENESPYLPTFKKVEAILWLHGPAIQVKNSIMRLMTFTKPWYTAKKIFL